MADTPDTSLSDLALQKIGRNVLNVQKIEGLLKWLVAFSHMEGGSKEVQNQLDELRDSASKQTMGVAVGEFFEKIYSEVEVEEIESPPGADMPWMAFGFRITESEEIVAARKEAFATLVKERNHLIHHRLMKFDLHSRESCVELISELDAQNDRMQAVHDYLKDQVEWLAEMRSILQHVSENEILRGDRADA